MDKPTCSIDGCEKVSKTRGWCGMHYRRWQRHGDPLATPREDKRNAPRPCPRCGDTEGEKFHSQTLYCHGCWNAVRRERRQAAYRLQPDSCGWCRGAIEVRRAGKVYCSADCKIAATRTRQGFLAHPETAICALAECSAPFERSRLRNKFCSDKCGQRSSYLRRKDNPNWVGQRGVYNRSWYSDNRERILENAKRWRADNAETVERSRAAWRAANPGAHGEKERRRRARKAATMVAKISLSDLAGKSAYWGDRCWMCGSEIADSWDHVKPLSAGGPHILANLRPACRSCNSSKNGKWPFAA